VDSFIYSPSLIDSNLQGTTFSGMMHVSDWFPTILDLADISYSADDDYALDGVSQVDAWSSGSSARDYMLYNWYYNVKDQYFDMWKNGSFAIRNSKYKLMHAYDSSTYGAWYTDSDLVDNDDVMEPGSCGQSGASTGTFTKWLFDLENDPYETTNLFDNDDDDDIASVKSDLYAELESYASKSSTEKCDWTTVPEVAYPTWKAHNNVRKKCQNTASIVDHSCYACTFCCVVLYFSTWCRGSSLTI
jgi:arylsulfatase A-like enzyme